MLHTVQKEEDSVEIIGLLERYLAEHPNHDLDEEIPVSLMKIFGHEFFPEKWRKGLSTKQAQTEFVHIFRAILIKYIDNDLQINTNEYLIALSNLLSNERDDGVVINEDKSMRDATRFLEKFRVISSQLVNTCTLRPRVQTIILRILGQEKNTHMRNQPRGVKLFHQILHQNVILSDIPRLRRDISDKTFAQIRGEK